MQTTHSLDPSVGQVGTWFAKPGHVTHAVASEEIPFGVMVGRATDGTIRRYRTGDKMLGVSLARNTRESGSYAEGDSATWKQYEEVPVARKGLLWAQFESNAASVALLAANLHGSTTVATDRGKFTSRATSASAGAEVDATTALFWRIAASSATQCLVELNLP
jgi:hypothetical protein